jgi:hypothetical protein
MNKESNIPSSAIGNGLDKVYASYKGYLGVTP